MHRVLFLFVCFLWTTQNSVLVEGCHAGHTQTPDSGNTDEEVDEYDYSDYDYSSTMSPNATSSIGRSRRKRQAEQFETEYTILRRYFRDCLYDTVPEIWDWASVVDFTILKTLWFFYSGTIECTESSGKDNAECWKLCIDVYLRNTSTLIGPAKQCVEKYEADYRKDITEYKRVVKTFDPPTPAPTDTYTECVQAQYNEADPYLVAQSFGFSTAPIDSSLDITNVVDFVRQHVLCVICDYSPLPLGENRPESKNNILIGETELTDGSIVYNTTWPFGLEALIRKDARLRYAINFCNKEFEGTFRKDPPPNLGWTAWYEWGVCNAVCGLPGSQIRQRECLDNTRRNCLGSKTESRACFNRDCAYWSQWGEYTPCISTCDLSEQYSFRFCVNGKYGDVGCQGERRRRMSCAVSSCPVPWSVWSSCSASCGEGAQYRSGGASVMKVKTESRRCKIKDCPQQWSQWSPWGPCSKTCGVKGYRSRLRVCESKVPCTGNARERAHCGAHLPPCQDTWGSWTSWSSCNYQMRTRICYGGDRCVGENDEYQSCPRNITTVPHTPRRQYYQWSNWSQWSQCDRSCGKGRRSRSRLCGGSPSIPTNLCVGNNLQYLQCIAKPCHSSGSTACANHYIVDKTCHRNRINCLGEIGKRFCKKSCGLC